MDATIRARILKLLDAHRIMACDHDTPDILAITGLSMAAHLIGI